MTIVATSPAEPRRGIVLLAVLVVVVILALAAYQYSDLMLSAYKGEVNAHRLVQARAFAESGVHTAIAYVSSAEAVASVNGNVFDNPSIFQNIAIGDETKGKVGRFTLIAPPDPNSGLAQPYRSGVVDEGGKININAIIKLTGGDELLYQALLKLPNMTTELAASIVDWVDADDQPREGGAEIDYYSSLSPSYRTKNGPLDSIDELLLVKGMTREILYGNDLNRNGIQDGDEAVNTDGYSHGLAAFLTIYSRDHNTDAQGLPLIDLNLADLPSLYETLAGAGVDEDLVKFIVLARQYRVAESTQATPTAKNGDLASWSLDSKAKPKYPLVSSFNSLVNKKVTITTGTGKDAQSKDYLSPLNDKAKCREMLPKLYKAAHVSQTSSLAARININTAPAEVLAVIQDLAAIPIDDYKLTDADVQTILQTRPLLGGDTAPDPIFETPTWLYTEANLSVEKIKRIESIVTTRAQVYRIQAVGYFDGGGPSARVEAVVDANNGRPRILMWRDLTELGVPKLNTP